MGWTIDKVADALNLDPQTAEKVIGIVRGQIDPFTVPAVEQWARQCYNTPKDGPEVRMLALDALIGTHGTEAIWGSDPLAPVAEYCNAGDTYDTTILYDYTRGRYVLTSWGDWVEAHGDRLGVQ